MSFHKDKILSIVQKARKIKRQVPNNKPQIIAYLLDSKYRIITYGLNSYTKTHTLQERLAKESGNDHKIWLHAEVAALARFIRNANVGKITKIDKILIVRFTKDGKQALAMPCDSCKQAITLAGINHVIWTDYEGFGEKWL